MTRSPGHASAPTRSSSGRRGTRAPTTGRAGGATLATCPRWTSHAPERRVSAPYGSGLASAGELGTSTSAPPAERLDADFLRLWTAFGASQVGSAVGYGALPLVAILVLGASTFQVTALAALAGLASASIALRLGPFVEFHRKRPVMVAADLLRFVALGSVPLAAALDLLTFAQLCVVAVVATACDITFTAAGSAHLKGLVPASLRLAANSRLEATVWACSTVATPLGGVLVSVLGATVTMGVDAVSYLLSALGVRAIRRPEPAPPARDASRPRTGDLTAGWSYILGHRGLRALFWNAMLFGGALMVTSSLLAVFMLRDLELAAWQYGVAMGAAGAGGIAGAACAPALTRRLGPRRVLMTFGVARTLSLGLLPLAPPGALGWVVVAVAELLLLFCAGVFNPAFATYRMRATDDAVMSRVTMAWSMSAKLAQPLCIVLGGVLATATTTRTALAVAAGALVLSGLLLPWRAPDDDRRRTA